MATNTPTAEKYRESDSGKSPINRTDSDAEPSLPPQNRLREARKQLEIAREDVSEPFVELQLEKAIDRTEVALDAIDGGEGE